MLRWDFIFGNAVWLCDMATLEVLFRCLWDVMILLFRCDVLKNYLCMFGLIEEVASKSLYDLYYLRNL